MSVVTYDSMWIALYILLDLEEFDMTSLVPSAKQRCINSLQTDMDMNYMKLEVLTL